MAGLLKSDKGPTSTSWLADWLDANAGSMGGHPCRLVMIAQ